MFSLDETGDRVALVQMNAELRHAQLEMLSAQCATDRLRLRYSAEQLARQAHPDILRKAWTAASSLFDYYSSIVKQMPDRDARMSERDPREKLQSLTLTEAKLLDSSERIGRYIREQQSHFLALGSPLTQDQRAAVASFFAPELLARVRLVSVDPKRAPSPPLLLEAKAFGVTNAAELMHPSSLTFYDVLLFTGEPTNRALFHALVHAVQFEVLGLDQYTDLLVRGFAKTGLASKVPLEAHALALEAGFAEGPAKPFSVEEKVRLWANQGRYSEL